MTNNTKQFVSKKIELIIIGFITLVFLGLMISNLSFIVSIHTTYHLNDIIITVFGILFGLLLTAYSILFGLIPSLKADVLETEAFSSVNFRFFFTLVLNIILLVLCLVIYFFYLDILIISQLTLVVVLIQMYSLLLLYLFLLFRISRKERTEKATE